MELEALIKRLGWYQGQKVFLLARDRSHDKARDKDIWSLIGPMTPMTLAKDPSSYLLVRESLEAVEKELRTTERPAVEPAEDDPGFGPGYGQKIFFLIRHEVSQAVSGGGECADSGNGKGPRKARDKDIWSLTQPLPSGSLVGAFVEIPCPHCAGATEHPSHLLMALQGPSEHPLPAP